MKLRTTHNSIRIRIRKSEIQTLAQQRLVSESIAFPMGVTFGFSLLIDEANEAVEAKLVDNQLSISLPLETAKQWINTNEVGIERHLPLSGNEQLHILVEKDFPCLDRENEDKSDTFWELAPDAPEAC